RVVVQLRCEIRFVPDRAQPVDLFT
ncbi:MAG: hypothetical protein K0S98_2151, partial [Propionibacteriaceae bacterium]|nr:hypothetical protein [Propionibacteriaceae bacterium]